VETYVADTHSFAWFIAADTKLSKRAHRIFEQAEEAVVEVLIPTVVLAEMTYIAQRKRVRVTIAEVLKRIEQGDGFVVVPFDFAIFQTMLQLPDAWEIHDRIIAATAHYYKAKLITRDRDLRRSDQVATVW
jgi:predicted nucleic acid-binding protein